MNTPDHRPFESLEDLLTTPLLPSETLDVRIGDVLDAMPNLNDKQRLRAVLSILIQPADLSSVRKPDGRPGILEEFARVHPWMWSYRKGKPVCKAHSWLYAAVAEARLLDEIEKRGGQKRGRLRTAARQILREEYLGAFRNPWFIPRPRPAQALSDTQAIEKITTFYQQNGKRKAMRLAELEKQVGAPLTKLCIQLGTGRHPPLKKSLSKPR